jgi:hypothetical protein
MKAFTSQKKLIAGSAIQLLLNYCQENLFGTWPFCRHRWGGTVTIWNEHRHNTTKYNLEYELTKTKQNKEAVGSARRLLQYCQLPDKNSLDISRDIWNFSRYFKIFICLFHDFSRNPWRCSAEPWLGNTAITHAQPRIYTSQTIKEVIPHTCQTLTSKLTIARIF